MAQCVSAWGVFDVEIPHRNTSYVRQNGERRGGMRRQQKGIEERKKRTEYRSVFSALIDSEESLQPSAVVDLGRGFSL